jgi:hypothetical protein
MSLLVVVARRILGARRQVMVRMMVVVMFVVMFVVLAVLVVLVMVIMVIMVIMAMLLSYPLAASALFLLFLLLVAFVLLLDRVAERLPLLLVPRTQTLPAEHEIVIVDDDRLHPGVAAVLLVRDLDFGEVVVLRILGRRV